MQKDCFLITWRETMITANRIAVIGAHTIDLAYGLGNDMPWPRSALKQDMSRFKHITTQAPAGKKNLLIVGRETFETMGSKALPNRYMVVISKKFESVGLVSDNTFCSPSIESFLNGRAEKIEDLHHIFFIGGESIWKEGFKFASRAYITIVNREVENQDNLKRLSSSLVKQAEEVGFTLKNDILVRDDWSGPVNLNFLEYSTPCQP